MAEVIELLSRYFCSYCDLLDEDNEKRFTNEGNHAYEELCYLLYEVGKITGFKDEMGNIINTLDEISVEYRTEE